MSFELIMFAEKVNSSTDFNEVWSTCHSAFEDLGVTSICYAAFPTRAALKNQGITRSGFVKRSHPDEWVQSLGSTPILDTDVTTEMVVGGSDTIFWYDEALIPNSSDAQSEQYEAEIDIGMQFGVTLQLTQSNDLRAAAGIGICFRNLNQKQFNERWNS